MKFKYAEIFKSDSACSFISGVIQGNVKFALTHLETALESMLK